MEDPEILSDVLDAYIPVDTTRLAGPQEERAPQTGIALCLSGGGYRAMLFHLGALWRLNEWGYLAQLNQVSSVSGGSITAALLGLKWSALAFDTEGMAQRFIPEVVEPLRRLAGMGIDVKAIVLGLLGPGTITDRVTAAYRAAIFGNATLQQLPDSPFFVINASNLQSGVLWRFTKAYMADYRVGLVERPQLALARAVAASSAFPPFLSPVRLRLRSTDYAPLRPPFDTSTDLHTAPYTTNVRLTDGGVYDNLGLETAWKNWKTILVSDGGQKMRAIPRPWSLWPLQILRVLNLIDNQVRNRRKDQLLRSYRLHRLLSANEQRDERVYNLVARAGAYWHMSDDLSVYERLDGKLDCPFDKTTELAQIATRLARLDDRTQERLINWGYAVCDVQMRLWVDPALPPPVAFPYPCGVG